ncbi:MAG: hypothetical protein M3Z17_03170 [Gemmatimonadota bacterium]|nr:hypothetical protein [Gemmatimonadota bacterium]
MTTFTLTRQPPPSAVEYPAAELIFGADGTGADVGELAAIRSEFASAGVTDLLVLCGGCADRDSDLRTLYDGLAGTVLNAARRDPAFAAHTYGILRIIWPVRRWPDLAVRPGLQVLTPDERAHREIASLEMEVTALRGSFSGRQADRHLLKVWQLISTAAESVPAQVSLVEHVRELVRGTDEMNPDPKPAEYASRRFLTMHPIRLLEAITDPAEDTAIGSHTRIVAGDQDGDEGADGPPYEPAKCDLYEGVRNLLRYAVASEMRSRAETLGRQGLRESLLTLSRGLPQTRLHLVGHSYGARALLTAVDAPTDSGKLIRPKSISLLQPALPEDAFVPATEDSAEGIFHSVLAEGKVGGPILVSHSKSDETAGIPYAIACRIAEQSQPLTEDYQNPVRAMAEWGATGVEGVTVSLAGRSMPRWRRGMLANLDGAGVIESHLDVCKLPVAQAILSAATTTT